MHAVCDTSGSMEIDKSGLCDSHGVKVCVSV